MTKDRREANRLNDMTGLTQEAHDAINGTPLNLFYEFWHTFKTAQEINDFVHEMNTAFIEDLEV